MFVFEVVNEGVGVFCVLESGACEVEVEVEFVAVRAFEVGSDISFERFCAGFAVGLFEE